MVALSLLFADSADAFGRRPQSQFAHLPKSEVSVVTPGGCHRFTVWIAADDASRERGLMFVRQMPADHGMLFLFERPQFAAFWMKNTYLSLDLVFISADGRVVNLAPDARPLSEDPIPSSAPVKAVLELLAGTAARIGLAPGSRIVHPAFAEKAAPAAPAAQN